jgi:hypothetical protein
MVIRQQGRKEKGRNKMSNLNLETFEYKELSKLPPNKRKKLGYETYAENKDGMVVVYHHGNAIAGIHKDKVELDTCGWNSVTTTNRMSQIVKDNLGTELFGVSKVDYVTSIRVRTSKAHIPFRRATLYKNGKAEIKG